MKFFVIVLTCVFLAACARNESRQWGEISREVSRDINQR
jgi:hypothetical protein